jgi:hypothetical protein
LDTDDTEDTVNIGYRRYRVYKGYMDTEDNWDILIQKLQDTEYRGIFRYRRYRG